MTAKSLKVVIVGELDKNGAFRPHAQNSIIIPYFDNNMDCFLSYVEKRFEWLGLLRENLQLTWLDNAGDSIHIANQKEWRMFKLFKQQTPVTKTPTVYIKIINYSAKPQNGVDNGADHASIASSASQTECSIPDGASSAASLTCPGHHMSGLEAAARAFEAGAKAVAEAAKMAATNAKAAEEAAKAAEEAAKAVQLAILACKSSAA